MRAHAGSGAEKDADADRVDELQLAQIDDDLGRVRSLDAGQFIVQRLGTVEIKLTAERYDVRVAVARGPQRERRRNGAAERMRVCAMSQHDVA